jgi:hypothetical protein
MLFLSKDCCCHLQRKNILSNPIIVSTLWLNLDLTALSGFKTEKE